MYNHPLSGTITERDLWELGEECGVEIESVEQADGGWKIEYGFGETEEYATGEEAIEAIRAYGSGNR